MDIHQTAHHDPIQTEHHAPITKEQAAPDRPVLRLVLALVAAGIFGALMVLGVLAGAGR